MLKPPKDLNTGSMAVNNPGPFTMHSFSKSYYGIYKDILVMIYTGIAYN